MFDVRKIDYINFCKYGHDIGISPRKLNFILLIKFFR